MVDSLFISNSDEEVCYIYIDCLAGRSLNRFGR